MPRHAKAYQGISTHVRHVKTYQVPTHAKWQCVPESANAYQGVLGSSRVTQGSIGSKIMEVNEYEGMSGSVNEC